MIAQQELDAPATSAQRGAVVLRLADLADSLVKATQDFADAGFEDTVAQMIAAQAQS